MFRFSDDALKALSCLNVLAGMGQFNIVTDPTYNTKGHVSMYINYMDEDNVANRIPYQFQIDDLFAYVKQVKDIAIMIDEVFQGLDNREDEYGKRRN
jgi:hypothetical protein